MHKSDVRPNVTTPSMAPFQSLRDFFFNSFVTGLYLWQRQVFFQWFKCFFYPLFLSLSLVLSIASLTQTPTLVPPSHRARNLMLVAWSWLIYLHKRWPPPPLPPSLPLHLSYREKACLTNHGWLQGWRDISNEKLFFPTQHNKPPCTWFTNTHTPVY